MDITDAFAAGNGTEANSPTAFTASSTCVRDMDSDTTEVELQKAFAELAGVPVEALKVKTMRPADGNRNDATCWTH